MIFPIHYTKQHKHKRRMVTNIMGTYYRCELCGEFPIRRKVGKIAKPEKAFKQPTLLETV